MFGGQRQESAIRVNDNQEITHGGGAPDLTSESLHDGTTKQGVEANTGNSEPTPNENSLKPELDIQNSRYPKKSEGKTFTFSITLPTFHFPEITLPDWLTSLWKKNYDDLERHPSLYKVAVEQVDFLPFTDNFKPDSDGRYRLTGLMEIINRNDIKQSGVPVALTAELEATSKVIKLPPVMESKVIEIIKYEARQYIPLDLRDAEWRWQLIGQSIKESGFLINGEASILAFKKELPKQMIDVADSVLTRKQLDLFNLRQQVIIDSLWGGTEIQNAKHKTKGVLAKTENGYEINLLTSEGSFWSRKINLPSNSLQDLGQEISRSLGYWKAANRAQELISIDYLGDFSAAELETVRKTFQSLGISCKMLASPEQENSKVEVSPNAIIAYTAALQRLGIGKYRHDFLPDGKPYSDQTKEAWGIDIAPEGIYAVKLRRVES